VYLLLTSSTSFYSLFLFSFFTLFATWYEGRELYYDLDNRNPNGAIGKNHPLLFIWSKWREKYMIKL
jgi:hypothetical protein